MRRPAEVGEASTEVKAGFAIGVGTVVAGAIVNRLRDDPPSLPQIHGPPTCKKAGCDDPANEASNWNYCDRHSLK